MTVHDMGERDPKLTERLVIGLKNGSLRVARDVSGTVLSSLSLFRPPEPESSSASSSDDEVDGVQPQDTGRINLPHSSGSIATVLQYRTFEDFL